RLVRRKENVRWRTFFDLACQKARRSKIEHDFVAGLFLVIRGDFLQRVRQARGGKDGDVRRVQNRHCEQQPASRPQREYFNEPAAEQRNRAHVCQLRYISKNISECNPKPDVKSSAI